MLLAKLLAGVCSLFLGRRLFWLFVGVVGFAAGVEIAAEMFKGTPEIVVLGLALLLGVAGAALAMALEKLMIGVVGFVAGSYLGIAVLTALTPYPGRNIWLAVLVGGFVGAMLLVSLFDWALIVLSSLVGAGLILDASHAR